MALCLLPSRVEAEQLTRDLFSALLDPPARPLPLAAAEPGQLGMRLGATDITVNAIEVLGGHEESIAFCVLQEHVLVHGAAVVGDRAHLDEAGDAVVAMHHQVARGELQDEGFSRGVAAGRTSRAARRRGHRAA